MPGLRTGGACHIERMTDDKSPENALDQTQQRIQEKLRKVTESILREFRRGDEEPPAPQHERKPK